MSVPLCVGYVLLFMRSRALIFWHCAARPKSQQITYYFTKPSYKGRATVLILVRSAWRNVPDVKTQPLLHSFGTFGMMLSRPTVLRGEQNNLLWQPMTSCRHHTDITHMLKMNYLILNHVPWLFFSLLYRLQSSSSLKRIVSFTNKIRERSFSAQHHTCHTFYFLCPIGFSKQLTIKLPLCSREVNV